MNKWLLRLLRQTTKKVRPTFSALLIREIGDRAKRARNQRDFVGKIKIYANWTARSLQQTGRIAKKAIANFVKAVKMLAEIWTFVVKAVSEASCQPRIRLLRWLKPSLRNNQVSEKIDLVLEEVKCRLIEKYWPPTRQRCDSIALPTNGAAPITL
ncbi:hypothetical protein QUA43_30880 [Microcoleus sp. N9_B4]|uniref:hypothetical protein n=1 Tax=Microcoleus sp. N9_B4 TaxID=3055386 RepID=UPI002FD2BE7A